MTTPDNPCMYSQTIHGWWGDPPMGKACNFGGGGGFKNAPRIVFEVLLPNKSTYMQNTTPKKMSADKTANTERSP